MAESTTPNVEDVEKWKFSYTASENELVQLFEEQFWSIWQSLNQHTSRPRQFYC